jgi:hypothetical protein
MLLAAVVFIGIAIYVGKGSRDKELPHLKVDLDSFYAQGRSNEVALQEKLKGHLLEIEGYVGSVTAASEPEIAVVTRGGKLTARMSDSSKVAELTVDQAVTLLCEELYYAGTLGSRGRGCEVLSVGKVVPGTVHELERVRQNNDTNEFVNKVVSDTAKNLVDDIKGVASAVEAPAENASAASARDIAASE